MHPARNSPASRWTSWRRKVSGRPGKASVESARVRLREAGVAREGLRTAGRAECESAGGRPEPYPVAQHAPVIARVACGHHQLTGSFRNKGFKRLREDWSAGHARPIGKIL